MMTKSIWCSPDWFFKDRNTLFHLIQNRIMVPGRDALVELEDMCLNPEYRPSSGRAIKASTFSSDFVDRRQYLKDRENGGTLRISDPRYREERPFANDIAICHWWMVDEGHGSGWAKIDPARVAWATTPEYRQALGSNPPIDGLKTFGTTMLHEVGWTRDHITSHLLRDH